MRLSPPHRSHFSMNRYSVVLRVHFSQTSQLPAEFRQEINSHNKKITGCKKGYLQQLAGRRQERGTRLINTLTPGSCPVLTVIVLEPLRGTGSVLQLRAFRQTFLKNKTAILKQKLQVYTEMTGFYCEGLK